MIDPKNLAGDSLIEAEFLQELRANGMATGTLENYRKAVETLGTLDKSPEEIEKGDLIDWSTRLQEDYAEGTANLYKTLVKRYFKWFKTGDLNGGEYPPCVKWMKNSKSNGMKLPKEILSCEEIKRMAEAADNQRDRAMIWVGYESGCRPGELINMKIRDVEFDKHGAQVMVDGKTGERRIRLVESVPDLKLWLSMHPRKEDRSAFLWRSQKGGHLANVSWRYNLRKCADKAGVKKNVHPHLLRHSRATHLAAKSMNEAQMREIFGWTKDSNMPSVYVHLSGRDTDEAVLSLYGIDVKSSENQLEMGVKKCSFCGHENSPNAKFCSECNAPLDAVAAESSDKKVREQDQLTKKVIQRLMEKAPEALEEVLEEEDINRKLEQQGELAKV